MANAIGVATKQFHSELGVSVKEDLMDRIINKSPLDTPLFSMTPDGGSTGTLKVEYLVDSTTGGFAANAFADGADYEFAQIGDRDRKENYCQLINTTWSVGKLIDSANQAGITSEYAYQMNKAMGNHGLSCEYAITYGVSAGGSSAEAGASAVASKMNGFVVSIQSHKVSADGSTSADFTVAAVNQLVQDIVTTTTGKPHLILCAPVLKSSATSWALPSTKNINVEDKRYVASIAVFDGDFALFTFQWNRWLTKENSPTVAGAHVTSKCDRALILDMSTWDKVTYLRTTAEEVPAAAFARRGAMNTCFTIRALAEQCNGIFSGETA